MSYPQTSAEIRQAYLKFFEENGHRIVASSSLVPGDDPTLLFVNAGMVQFKDTFLGLEKRAYTRATTSQKCMRVSGKHNDLENVGPSPRHHTFFEMLGNFSFGDYFKRHAMRFAYELVTQTYGLPSERIVYTVHTSDDEAYDIWTKELEIEAERVYRMGDATNFWQMADVGPCGPTSELHYDWGKEACTCGQPDCSVLLDNGCERWLEIWNLVFMQFNQTADGSRTPLPKPGVDTGMGLERIVSVIQNKAANYETDLFTPIIAKTQSLLGHSQAQVEEQTVAYRVIADHSRAITFMIGDGVMPGNEGRAYVLRLILRRAARYGRKLGFTEPFLAQVAETVIAEMGGHYTELVNRRQFILNVIKQEEERFLHTYEQGLTRLTELVTELRSAGQSEIPGEDVFKLHATYGFPVDLTRDIAAEEYDFSIDRAGFVKAMTAHQAVSSSGAFKQIDSDALSVYANLLEKLQDEGHTLSQNPYEGLSQTATVLAILQDGTQVERVEPGYEVEVVLDKTPFYVESGGQVSDMGHLITPEGLQVRLNDARKLVSGLVVHYGQVNQGELSVGQSVVAVVDETRRQDIMRNHTATHLLHAHLRQTLGDHVAQAGSLVAPDRLRFDFSHPDPVTDETLTHITAAVNADILAGYKVSATQEAYKTAVERGAMALFGEKYGDVVRLVTIGEDVSLELCGGTHVNNTSQIGPFLITNEGSVAAGVRRIEALTGAQAQAELEAQRHALSEAANHLGVKPTEVPDRLARVLSHNQQLEKEVQTLKRKLARAGFESHLAQTQDVAGVQVLALRVEVDDSGLLREMGDWFRDRLDSGVIVLGTVLNDKPSFIAMVTDDLVKRGLHAGKMVKAVAQVVGGGGGGRPTMAQAGGREAAKLDEALAIVPSLVESALQ